MQFMSACLQAAEQIHASHFLSSVFKGSGLSEAKLSCPFCSRT